MMEPFIANDQTDTYTINPSFISTTIFFFLMFLFELALLFKVGHKKLDYMGIFLIITQTIVMLVRWVLQLTVHIWHFRFNLDTDNPAEKRYIMIVYLAIDLGQAINWIALSIFVFKMETIRKRLKCSSFKEF